MDSDGLVINLLTVKQVARLLQCSKAHVCNAIAGKLRGCRPMPAVKMGRRMLVRRESLLTWIEQNERGNGKLDSSSERGNRIA
jgi:excisionase family DNA binding protein